MNFKISCLLAPVILCMGGVASAQNFTGSIGIQEDTSQTGSYTASSLTLDSANFTEPGSATGTFYDAVPNGTFVTAFASNISGLSSVAETISAANFLQIGTSGYFGSTGTTPNNRFDFDLQSLAESAPGDFSGTGTLVDTSGSYSDTSAEMLLSFSSANNYSFTLQVVPEPGILSLLMAGLGFVPFFRRKN